MGKKLYLERTAVVPDKQRMPSPVNPIVGTLKLWMSTRSDFDDKLAARKVSVKSATRRVLAATKDRRAWADHARDALDVETDPRYMRGAGRRDSTPASRSASAAPSEASLAAAAAATADGSDGVGGIGSGAADGANGTANSDQDGGGDVTDSSAKVDAALAAAAASGGEPLSELAGGGGGVPLAHQGDGGGGDIAAAQGDSSNSGGGDGDDAAAKGGHGVGVAAASDSEQAAYSEALDLDLGIDRARYWTRYDSVDLDSEPDAISGRGGMHGLRSTSSAAAAAAGGGSLGHRRPAAISSSSAPRRGAAATATSPRAGAHKSKRSAAAGGAAGGGLRRSGPRRKLWHPPPPSLGAIKRKKLWCPMCCGMCASAHAVEAAMHMLSLRGGGGDASRRRPLPKLSLYSLQSGTTAFT